VASEKEGKLFVQVLYPNHSFADGVPLTTLYIKVVQHNIGRVVPVRYCNNKFFTAAFKEVLKSTKDVDLVSEWLNYAMEFMVETETRETCFGADVQKLSQGKWPVNHMNEQDEARMRVLTLVHVRYILSIPRSSATRDFFTR
jgi:hypothetical protein